MMYNRYVKYYDSIIVLVIKNYGCLNSSDEDGDKVDNALLVCSKS